MGLHPDDGGVLLTDPTTRDGPRPPGSFRHDGPVALAEWKLMLDTAVVTGGNFHGASYERVGGSTTDAVAVFRGIFEEFRQSYVVHYQPQNVAETGWHDLVVTVKGVDAKGVRARKGYFAGGN
jgi:hypothetical protein